MNQAVVDAPETVNDDPYGKGWLIKVKPSNLQGDLATLMKANDGKFVPVGNRKPAK